MKAIVVPLVDQARFWSKVDVRTADECWAWRAAVDSNGYGQFKLFGRQHPAPRVAYAIANPDEDMGGLFACHRCDNPICVNPAHIFLGTARANTRDMVGKGRHRNGGSSAQAKGAASRRRRTETERLPALLAAIAGRIEAGEPVTYRSVSHLDGYWAARRTLGLSHSQIISRATEEVA